VKKNNVHWLISAGKIESGKFELEMAPFSMQDLVTSLSCSFKAMMDAKSIRFTASIDPIALDLLNKYDLVGDRNRIRQVALLLGSTNENQYSRDD
jgi:signal transduction histidine kinase